MTAGPPNIRVRGVRQRLPAGTLIGRVTPGAGPAQVIEVGPQLAAALKQGASLGGALGSGIAGAAGPPGAAGAAGPAGPAGPPGSGQLTTFVVTGTADVYITG